MTAKRIIFIGRVQGVGFRYTAHRIAGRYDIAGYVRNQPDGTVEMFGQGAACNIDSCIHEIRDYFGSYVRRCNITDVPMNPQYTDFRITY